MEIAFSEKAVWRVEYAYTTPGELETVEESIEVVAPVVKIAAQKARERLENMSKKRGWAAWAMYSVYVLNRWEAPE